MNITRSWTFWQRTTPDPDSILLDKARHGSQTAFDSLRRLHESPLRGFVMKRVGIDGVDDLLQEIWLACWTGLPHYAGRARFKAWLYGIATHKCTDHLRSRSQNARREEAAVLEEADQPDAYRALDLREAVKAALAQLPEAQREVLELYYFAELTLAEIAETLSRNLNTVKYQFYRAHAQVAEEMKGEG